MADDSRIELQLRALNGEEVVPYPQSRVEKLLYKMNGYDIELDPPQSRVEELLKEYIDNGGGGGGGGSSDFSTINVTFYNTVEDTMTFYSIAGVKTDATYGAYYASLADVFGGDTPTEVSLLAYKGKVVLWIGDNIQNTDEDPPIVTGAIEYDEDSQSFTITGEGTITLKAASIM